MQKHCSHHPTRFQLLVLISVLIVPAVSSFAQTDLGKCYFRGPKGIEIRYLGGYPSSQLIAIKVPDADSSSFQLISDSPSGNCGVAPLYGKDDSHVFYRQQVIVKANPARFKVLAGGYATDDENIFFQGHPLPHVPPGNFRTEPNPDGTGYFGVSLSGVLNRDSFIKPAVDPLTFRALGGLWVKDKNHVYLTTRKDPIRNADPNSFVTLTKEQTRRKAPRYAKDKNHVFTIDHTGAIVIPDADPKTFTQINLNYAKDASRVYYKGRLVTGADASSFVIPHPVNSHTGYDKFSKYHLGEQVQERKVTTTDPAQ